MTHEEYNKKIKEVVGELNLGSWQDNVPLVVAHLPIKFLERAINRVALDAGRTWHEDWVKACEQELMNRATEQIILGSND